jgi:hypothetical protein
MLHRCYRLQKRNDVCSVQVIITASVGAAEYTAGVTARKASCLYANGLLLICLCTVIELLLGSDASGAHTTKHIAEASTEHSVGVRNIGKASAASDTCNSRTIFARTAEKHEIPF